MMATDSAPLGRLAWLCLLALLGIVGTMAMAFLWPPMGKLAPETVPPAAPPTWALPAGRVVLLLPAGSSVPAKWPYVRPMPEWQLHAAGFVLVRSAPELERAVDDGAKVIWLHRDAVRMVDGDWLHSRYRQGYAIGVIGGTMADLSDWFGLGDHGGGWIRPGSPRPAFAIVQVWECQVAPGVFRFGSSASSEWFSLPWLVGISWRAANPCAI